MIVWTKLYVSVDVEIFHWDRANAEMQERPQMPGPRPAPNAAASRLRSAADSTLSLEKEAAVCESIVVYSERDSVYRECLESAASVWQLAETVTDKTDGYQRQFIQTAYRTAKTTITCDYTGNKYKFFCKQNGFICEDILSTKSSLKSNGTFTLTETKSGFSVSISNVSSHDAGVYWCGVETHEGSYRAALRKIKLEVEDIHCFTRSPTVGEDLTFQCEYPNGALINKFLCKGEDPSICQPLVSTQRNRNPGKFSMKEDNWKRNITITVKEVTTDDTGTYWCGAKSTDKTRSNKFFHKMVMTVVSPTSSTSPVISTQSTTVSAESRVSPTSSTSPVISTQSTTLSAESRVSPTSSTSPVISTQSTTVSAESRGGSQVVVTVIVCVAVLLLLFVLILILIYKRFSHLMNTRKGAAAQNIREDYVYEEIQQPVQAPDSGNEMNTIYANANLPTNPSASLHYSTINFQSSSDRADGEAVILKPSSAACEYSTVKQNPSYWTVNQPSSSSEEPLYTTVNKPQQHRAKISPVRNA
ncbi:polymeric immunoglobulin receptor-like [Micropterus dolomieu]|uniref:polymeric immunoglobulin receptor-like n=1 Tax=Micropterus dolomieu TaxID=147949 RepID=UPI001E8D1470|nr:polymeric immunoglobulin receptor-like [Micropterus dolomieu]